ncbi:MAG: hypothetical protein OXK16_06345 [bacterium]|nr:hypothetical protein [bacterium]
MVLAEQAPGVESPRGISAHGETSGAEVFVLSPEELEESISRTLADAGCSLEQLRSEARSGEFSSESNWRLWFCISPFVETAT